MQEQNRDVICLKKEMGTAGNYVRTVRDVIV
jgi:hypothetical protein